MPFMPNKEVKGEQWQTSYHMKNKQKVNIVACLPTEVEAVINSAYILILYDRVSY